jgi:hypothetical protein
MATVEISTRTAELIVKDVLLHIGERAQIMGVCPDPLHDAFVVILGRADNEVSFYLKERDCEEYPTISEERVRGVVRRALLRLPG